MSRAQYAVRCVGIDQAVVREVVVDADSPEAAVAIALPDGGLVLSVRKRWSRPSFKRQHDKHRFPLFCREVRTLIGAGMTVVEAAETLSARERLEGRDESSVAAQVLKKLQQGQSLSVSIGQLLDAPPVLVAAIRSGERTSDLREALDDYLRFDTLVQQLRRKIVSAAMYPALVAGLGAVISIFLLFVVLPNFAQMYESLRGASSAGTSMMISLSRFLSANRGLALLGLAALAATFAWWFASGLARTTFAKFGARIPWIARRVQDFQLAMTYQALSLLLKGGYPMTEAIAVAAGSAMSGPVSKALASAGTRIEAGGSVSEALSREGLCDEVARRLMAAAERNGDFYLATDVVSKIYGERFEVFVERMTRIVEPILLLAVAIVVGGIVVMMYLPVFDMTTQMT